MPQVTVYRGDTQIDFLQFSRHFCIEVSEEDQAVYWKDDDSLGWHLDTIQSISYNDAQHPSLHVWLQGSLDSKSYSLPLLRHDWILEINRQSCQRGFYDSIIILWHNITLSYSDYHFDFTFEYLDSNARAMLPTPIKTLREIVEEQDKRVEESSQ